ncbi:eukaryotic translation initiation factor 4G-like isoform X2 [Amphibalanus amphitrite]|uniref:eukaryotic translation initiation factor 4G-like isoform X2 n=1 Tax=Amphibalanus amphitrite TaxID=1232801 RepID=UPI001C909D0C|nr:eukaryotic translation initiation factor 4G-like isoform X2 [Amphibalanus amphitrite]
MQVRTQPAGGAMCISPRPAGDSPPPLGPGSWLPRAPLAERHWSPLLRACLNRATPTNCAALVTALHAAVVPRAARPDTVPRLVRDVLAHVSVSGLYGPQNAALCGALADLRTPDDDQSFLELLTERCEAAALGEELVESSVRRHCAAFLGELHTAEVTSTERMWRWVARLEPRDHASPDPANVDSLCALLATGGAKLETEAAADAVAAVAISAAAETTDGETEPTPLDALFSRLCRLATSPGLDTRLRCLLLDTVELRQRGWRRRAHFACPQPIDELRAAAEAEMTAPTGRRRRRRRRQPQAT